ncbi:hypothetical protein L9F63_017544 [Diploptera punctata]|uniref:Dynactin subunit 3 n=1 Tax=Diploptera punctata TaxID=6984 RepID=A0AAD7ZZ47_DIPPU|nr:hypothetical protein L9F63_017544 [Diploptera punctata]
MLLTTEEPNEIDLIEARILDLEKRVLGDVDTTENFSPVVDSLITTNALICTALTGRETTSVFMRRLGELDKLLDPDAEDVALETRAKIEEVLVMEPQLKHNLKSLREMEELQPALDSEHIKFVPSLSDRLEKLTLFYLDKKQDSDHVTGKVMKLLQEYNAIITNITKMFVQFEETVTKCEVAAQPKKQPE